MKKQIATKQNVGIDISKDDFKVSFRQLLVGGRQRIKGSRTFKNTAKGFQQFVTWVERHRCSFAGVRITLEATGVYHEQLVYYLEDKTDYHLSVVLANQAKAFMKSLNQKSKTDKADAIALGQMGLERDLKQWKPISKNMLVLKQLVRERIRLLKAKTVLSNQLHALRYSYSPNKGSIKRIKAHIKLINKQIKEVEAYVKAAVEADKELLERIDNVCKARGLGLITVATVVAETGGFVLFTSQSQLISFAGYDVVHRQSGTSVNGKTRISKKGNKYIRRALYFPALTIVKYEPHFQQLYERVTQRTGIKMKGYVAVQRKLLILIYTLFKKNEAYDSGYEQKRKEAENAEKNQETMEKKTMALS